MVQRYPLLTDMPAERYHNSKEYVAWRQLHHHPRYCDLPHEPRWQDFFVFLADVGPAPSLKHFLRLRSRARGVVPGNVTWNTVARSHPSTRLVSYLGMTHPLERWAELTGISVSLLHRRLYVLNWSVEDALTKRVAAIQKPVRYQRLRPTTIIDKLKKGIRRNCHPLALLDQLEASNQAAAAALLQPPNPGDHP
jgi:hypothetical protein